MCVHADCMLNKNNRYTYTSLLNHIITSARYETLTNSACTRAQSMRIYILCAWRTAAHYLSITPYCLGCVHAGCDPSVLGLKGDYDECRNQDYSNSTGYLNGSLIFCFSGQMVMPGDQAFTH